MKNIESVGLKIDGVYIGEHKDDDMIGIKSFFILYNDGMCYFVVSWSKNSVEEIVNFLENNSLRNNSPVGWGLFNINSQKIQISNWQVMKDSFKYNRLSLNGVILDNETIMLDKGWGFENKTIFRYHSLINKPDSTNRFIK